MYGDVVDVVGAGEDVGGVVLLVPPLNAVDVSDHAGHVA